MTNINYFNQLTGKFNNDRFLQFNVYRKIFADLNRKINISKEDIILDLGGGCGELTKFLAGKCRRVVLADGAEKTLEYARSKLSNFNNISYKVADITKLPLPFSDNQFDKIICYSVVHYADSLENFSELVKDLLRITKVAGIIFIGDIPLADKYKDNLLERKKHALKNFLLNIKYYLKKSAISLAYKISKINNAQVKGVSYTRREIDQALNKLEKIDYKLVEQARKLPLADSREDLIIKKPF